jgi:peptidoglycan LD-endopeptidase LytH
MHDTPHSRKLPSFLIAALLLAAAPAPASGQMLPLFATAAPDFLRTAGSVHAHRDGPALLIPVVGIGPQDLRNSYYEGRSGGRTHAAIDIHAPRGTPVVAAADGTILRLHSGARGGLSVYHLGDDGRTRYYYAHLDGYAEGLHQGQRVRRGDVIGYVGDTGNAAPGDYHLHFSISELTDRSRWWQGRNLNPYRVLKAAYTGRVDVRPAGVGSGPGAWNLR